MAFRKIATGLQHIGVPTNDIEKTIAFYTALGFEVAHRTVNNGEQVAFLRLGDLTIETYQNGKAVGQAGAVDHIAVNVTDVLEARRIAARASVSPGWASGSALTTTAASPILSTSRTFFFFF